MLEIPAELSARLRSAGGKKLEPESECDCGLYWHYVNLTVILNKSRQNVK